MNNCSNIEGKIFLSNICQKWHIYRQKPERGVRPIWNLAYSQILWCSEKNLKITFWSLTPFIVKMEFEKYKYFTWIFLRLKYLMCFFQASVQLVPRFYSHLSCSLLQLQLILLQIPNLQLTAFNSYPNIYQKWNWAENNLQIFCLKSLNLKKMGAKEEISLPELFLKDSHIVQCNQSAILQKVIN